MRLAITYYRRSWILREYKVSWIRRTAANISRRIPFVLDSLIVRDRTGDGYNQLVRRGFDTVSSLFRAIGPVEYKTKDEELPLEVASRGVLILGDLQPCPDPLKCRSRSRNVIWDVRRIGNVSWICSMRRSVSRAEPWHIRWYTFGR